ncbi:alkene reductase [soil metagenome]
MSALFSPFTIGSMTLANRVVMAPMTRNRADEAGVLPAAAATYYAQRAGAGLIVSEGTQPSARGKGYRGTPGLHNDEQQQAWARVARAVHAEGGHIFVQLMHTGRIGHRSLLPAGYEVMAPSAIAADIEVGTSDGTMVPAPTPLAMTVDDIEQVIEDFADSARRAVDAGLDGVELHGANGYLLHQFLSPCTNERVDAYGGSAERRARFVIEVTRAVADRIGAARVGLRISPGGQFNDMADKGNEDTYLALGDALATDRIAYLHTLRRRSSALHEQLRASWPTALMINTGYMATSEFEDVAPLIDSGQADLVSVGRLFISNPDLVRRWREGHPRRPWDEETFYTSGERGYTDYPTIDDYAAMPPASSAGAASLGREDAV